MTQSANEPEGAARPTVLPEHTLVAGALGVTGRAVATYLQRSGGRVTGLSRRRPPSGLTTTHIQADVTSTGEMDAHLEALADVTHLVFAAYQEQPTLTGQIAPNVALLDGALNALERAGAPLRHVTLYQGNKYYGAHLGHFKTPAREDDPRLLGPNFYYDQQDVLAARAARGGWAYTLLRPEAVCGVAVGNPMNLLTVLAVYAHISREQGLPLRFPGTTTAYDALYQVTDARLLAKATVWAGVSPNAADEAFNITNGDTFRWKHLFPAVAGAFGMELAPPQPLRLSEHMPAHEGIWHSIVSRYGLVPTSYSDIAAWGFGDALFHIESDNVSSTIKARQAGFADCIDTERMFLELFDELSEERLLPPVASQI